MSLLIGTAFGNIIMSQFDVTNDDRYRNDTLSDQLAVFTTYLIDWGCALSSLFFVFLIPTQKSMAKKWRSEGEERLWTKRAVGFLLVVVFGFCSSLVLSTLTMFEETRCLPIAGGSGCNK